MILDLLLEPVSSRLLLVAGVLIVCALYIWRRYSSRRLLPPSPDGHFLWGNHELRSKPYLEVVLGTGYGDILTLFTPSETVVVLNTIDLATEILEKQSAATAGRPSNVMANQIMGWGSTLTFSQHDQRHKRLRRLIGSALNATAVRTYVSQQHETTLSLLRSIALDPTEFMANINQSIISLIMHVAYGYTLVDNDPFLGVTQQAMHHLSLATMTQFWVNWFPILRYLPSWFPGAGFQQIGQRGRELRESYAQMPFQAVVDSISNNHLAEPSFTSRMLMEKGEYDPSREDTDLIKTAAAAFFLAGTTTTSSFITTFVLAMALYPDLAAHAQAEITKIVQPGQLPSLDQRELLPYVDAFVQEAMRMYPPVPLGVPHRATNDIACGAYTIPKGTTIRSNIWAMLHDERVYSKPHTFNPSRFLGTSPDPDPRKVIFGFGRRSCPGLHLANNGTWLTCAGILWAFDISASDELVYRVAELGGKNSPDLYRLFQPLGVSVGPLPFKCKILPRQPDLLEILGN